MIRALFTCKNGRFFAFSIRGHASPEAKYGEDILCAAVSSAVYLAANTITENIPVKARVSEKSGSFDFTLKEENSTAQIILQGFSQHLLCLSQQYPEKIQVRIFNLSHNSEVRNHAEY